MFAGLNLLRVGAMQKMGLKEFEFSQNYMMFWDKLERANYFFEAIIETADRDVDDRTVAFLLDAPLVGRRPVEHVRQPGRKHGLVPKAFMPETESSSATRGRMNAVLRSQAARGRASSCATCAPRGAIDGAARGQGGGAAASSTASCASTSARRRERFAWQWTDKDSEFHRDDEMTPREFAAQVRRPAAGRVRLPGPRPAADQPFGRTFTVEYLGNVVGGGVVKYLNVDIELMKEIAQRTHRRAASRSGSAATSAR